MGNGVTVSTKASGVTVYQALLKPSTTIGATINYWEGPLLGGLGHLQRIRGASHSSYLAKPIFTAYLKIPLPSNLQNRIFFNSNFILTDSGQHC